MDDSLVHVLHWNHSNKIKKKSTNIVISFYFGLTKGICGGVGVRVGGFFVSKPGYSNFFSGQGGRGGG